MSESQLGRLPGASAERDAIHVAIAPVIAGKDVKPGDHVGLCEDGTAAASKDPIGIVDPFLTRIVNKGERFYLCLYPNTVTGMRHHWAHPAFGSADQLAISEAWLRDYAVRVNPYVSDPEKAYQKLISDLSHNEMFYHGTDLHGRWDVLDEEGLRKHAAVLGIQLDFETMNYSCSC